VKAIHAGLETGIIGKRFGGMDMISIGPQIEHAHSPDERVFIPSVEKLWLQLTATLEALAREK
jgi:dipeptidase D